MEKCYEIHHIVEQTDGGSDDPENLIVLCPNCHQHRYHRLKEFTRDQLRLYKAKLKEQGEIEKRLLLNLEEIRKDIGQKPLSESEGQIWAELQEAANNVSQDKSPSIYKAVDEMSRWLAERDLLRKGARRALELELEVQFESEKARWKSVSIIGIDENAWEKSSDFAEAYNLVFNLDRAPSSYWVEAFDNTYKTSFNLHKRKTFIRGDRLIMIVGGTDNMQEQADYAKQLIRETDHFIETLVLPNVEAEIERKKRSALQEFDTIRSLKSKTKDIKL